MYKKNREYWRILESTGLKREKLAAEEYDLTEREWDILTRLIRLQEDEDAEILYQIAKMQYGRWKKREKLSPNPEHLLQNLFFLCEMERARGDLDAADRYAEEGFRTVAALDLMDQFSVFLFEKFLNLEVRNEGVMEAPKDFLYIREAYAAEKLLGGDSSLCKLIELYLEEHYEKDVLADLR